MSQQGIDGELHVGLRNLIVAVEVEPLAQGCRLAPGHLPHHANEIEHVEDVAVFVDISQVVRADEVHVRRRLPRRRYAIEVEVVHRWGGRRRRSVSRSVQYTSPSATGRVAQSRSRPVTISGTRSRLVYGKDPSSKTE